LSIFFTCTPLHNRHTLLALQGKIRAITGEEAKVGLPYLLNRPDFHSELNARNFDNFNIYNYFVRLSWAGASSNKNENFANNPQKITT
jgi:hypothetical protein